MPDATEAVTVTAQPVALEDSITFEDGEGYTLSNDSDEMMFWRLATAAPDPDDPGHPLRPYRDDHFDYAAGVEKTWFWTRGGPGQLVITRGA